jgi:hypothetical protein
MRDVCETGFDAESKALLLLLLLLSFCEEETEKLFHVLFEFNPGGEEKSERKSIFTL